MMSSKYRIVKISMIFLVCVNHKVFIAFVLKTLVSVRTLKNRF